jgi:hypothetical protein
MVNPNAVHSQSPARRALSIAGIAKKKKTRQEKRRDETMWTQFTSKTQRDVLSAVAVAGVTQKREKRKEKREEGEI